VVGWESTDLAWFAVSDLPSAVLEELQDAVRAAEPLAGGVISMRGEAPHLTGGLA
jgi:hypothetical protein